MLLIVDITKGFQTQTAECLIIAEIMQKPIMIVMNKVDLIPKKNRQSTIDKVYFIYLFLSDDQIDLEMFLLGDL